MIDSHCHLADPKFAEDLNGVISRAAEAGVHSLITIADDLEESKRCMEIAEAYPHIYCTVGVHPHNAKLWKEGDREQLKAFVLSSPKVKALGEMGLDYHYMNSEVRDQKSAFKDQLELAKELNLPAVIHCREAIADLKEIIEAVDHSKVVLHCCTEQWSDVSWFVDRDYFLSFTGIATYPNASDIRDTITHCPLAQMMVETDAPYLAPVLHRGKRNEPAFVTEVAKCIAQQKGISLEEVDRVTTENAKEFFAL